jgi:hypothetical protein
VRRLPILACLLVVLPGCAQLRRLRPPSLPAVSAEQLLDGLAARRAAVTSLRARARLRGVRGLWTREALVVRRPDAVRIDVLSRAGLVLALGARGPLLWAYPPAEATRYEGPATADNLGRFLGAQVSVTDVVDVLLGLPPARTAAAPPDVVATRDGEYRLRLPLADGEQTIWFDGVTHAVVRAQETRGGAVALRVAFGDHRDGFPHSLMVGTPGAGEAELAYEAVEPNAPVDATLFSPPPATRVLPLESGWSPPAP